ncbi:MAG: 4Fe-4S binding protein [Candidatus Lokiarchaeota archaeon]|nr:4Fe-4S binding protein [Candidatus Lokiarchaeota archaeon]
MAENKRWFIKKINKFLENDESNKMSKVDGSFIFEPNVLVGIADGNDPIYNKYKEIIGKFYLTPSEAYEWYCEKENKEIRMKNLSIVAYILPINQKTKMENLNYSKTMPSERWAHTRLFGEQANMNILEYLINELKKYGINAFAPTLDKRLFKINRNIWASNWSHRHNCFAAGLGSFGLSDGFINARGKAMRCGSLIIDLKLPSDALNRPSDPYEYCINCGDCISRCPVNAISFHNRHDKMICAPHVTSTIPFINQTYGINIYACGLCQVGVSCSNGIPKK